MFMGLGFLFYIFVGFIWSLFGVQILIGFAEAFYAPAFDALFSRHTTKTKVGREWRGYKLLFR